jgi:hypothetical protein
MKVVVFSCFLDALRVIHEALGDTEVGMITGAVPPVVRQRIVNEFTNAENRRSGDRPCPPDRAGAHRAGPPAADQGLHRRADL